MVLMDMVRLLACMPSIMRICKDFQKACALMWVEGNSAPWKRKESRWPHGDCDDLQTFNLIHKTFPHMVGVPGKKFGV